MSSDMVFKADAFPTFAAKMRAIIEQDDAGVSSRVPRFVVAFADVLLMV